MDLEAPRSGKNSFLHLASAASSYPDKLAQIYRRLTSSPSRAKCSNMVEDVSHCLRDCAHSREIWYRMRAPSWRGFYEADMWTWVKELATGEHGIRFLVTLWGVWKWRNNMLFEDTPWQVHEAWRRICYEYDEIRLGMGEDPQLNMEEIWVGRWRPPASWSVKLNTDGSFRVQDDHVGTGGILRDSLGSWIAGFATYGYGESALAAETMALHEGLRLAWARGYHGVECEVDCQDLLFALDDPDASRFMPQLNDIPHMMRRQREVTLRHIPRECNRAADFLSKFLTLPGVVQLSEVPDPELQTILLWDSIDIT